MRYSVPQKANAAIFLTLVSLHGLVLFALPGLIRTNPYWGLILLPMAWLNIVHWGLIHEAIHKNLFVGPRANEWGGRVLSILMGPSFQVLRFGHLIHHKLNRHWHSEMVQNPSLRDKIDYYFNLFAGLYISELTTSWMMAALPRQRFMHIARASILKGHEDVAVSGERFFYERGNVIPTRMDALISVTLYTTAFYYAHMQWMWLAAFLALRAMVISFMDNIYHFATPMDNSKAGKELQLPAIASIMLLHGNYHETHHTNPNVPWTSLPEVHASQDRMFDGDFISHGMMQFTGPSAKNFGAADAELMTA